MAATATRFKTKAKRSSTKDAFPPTDRELALRGEIKTGWSTVAWRQNLKNLGMSQAEVAKIESVLKRAEVVEKVNQLRIGVEMMKHEQSRENQLGDGQRTCLMCGMDFSSQYRRRPTSVHFCDKCSSAVCSSCMLTDTRLSGETITLCPLCYEEKEIWKKSGAWFNNALPVIDIPQEELEKFEEQQKISQSRTFTLGKHTVETSAREFVNPYQLEAESESEEEEELKSLQLQDHSPQEPAAAAAASSTFPHLAFVDTPHLQQALQRPSPFKPSTSNSFPRGMAAPSDMFSEFRERMETSDSEPGEPIGRRLQPLGGEEGSQKIVRRGAMSTVDKTRLEESRKKALGSGSVGSSQDSATGSPPHRAQNVSLSSSAASISTSVEPTLTEFAKTSHKKEGGVSSGGRELPHPPRRPPPQLLPMPEGDDSLQSELNPVEVVVEPPTPKPRKEETPAKKKKKRDSGERKTKPLLEDEFKKVAVAPSSEPPILPPSKKPPVLPSATDEFRKVGMVAVATAPINASKPPPPTKPAPVHEVDEFHKVGMVAMATVPSNASKPPPPTKPVPIPVHEVDEFRKVAPKSKPPPRVGGSDHDGTSKKHSPPPLSGAELDEFRKVKPQREEFRKVSPPKQMEEKKRSSSPPPLSGPQLDEFRKVKPTSAPRATDFDEFRKVGMVAMATTSSSASSKPVESVEEKRRSVDEASRGQRDSMSPTTSLPPLPAKPWHMQQQQHQESPTKAPVPTPRSSKSQSDEDRKSIVSNSSLASQSSRNSPPPARESPRHRQSPPTAPVIRAHDRDSLTRSEDLSRSRVSPVRRQGELDGETKEEAFRFRSRSGAVKSGVRGRSTSPLPTQKQPEQRSQKEDSDKTRSFDGSTMAFDDFEEFQPRMRTRSGAVDSRSMPQPRGTGSLERRSPQPPNSQLVHSITEVPQSSASEQEFGNSLPSVPTVSSDDVSDVSQPRMRTRSKAFHGDSRRPRPVIGRRGSKEKEGSPSSDDMPQQPRMRTRSRAIHGKRPARNPSPNPPRSTEGHADTDIQASLEIPFTRPRSSSTGQAVRRESENSSSLPPGTKPDGAFGSVELDLTYVESENRLQVTVAKCKGLRAMDGNGLSDPYVKLFLLPGNRIHRFQTKTIYKNLDPMFDETFMFYSVSLEAMKTKQLCVIVMDYDEFSADDFIGATRVKLYECLYAPNHKISIRRLLDDNIVAPTAREDKTRGRVRLTFSYLMEKQAFSVYVHKADHLVPDSTKGICDPYVKCYFESAGGGTCTKKKTNVSRKTLSPTFNQVLEFPEKLKHLGLACLTVSVWDRSKLPSMEIGVVKFKDAGFWKQFVAQPDLTVTEWYVLYTADHTHRASPKHQFLTLSRKYF